MLILCSQTETTYQSKTTLIMKSIHPLLTQILVHKMGRRGGNPYFKFFLIGGAFIGELISREGGHWFKDLQYMYMETLSQS